MENPLVVRVPSLCRRIFHTPPKRPRAPLIPTFPLGLFIGPCMIGSSLLRLLGSLGVRRFRAGLFGDASFGGLLGSDLGGLFEIGRRENALGIGGLFAIRRFDNGGGELSNGRLE